MIQAIQKRLFGMALLLMLFVSGLSGCGGDKTTETKDTKDTEGTQSDVEEVLLDVDEQRALRAELSIEADQEITEENFDEEFKKLRKEIEADL